MKKILLLGSGELGKEFVISAQRKGQHIIACDSYAGAPAMQVADEFEVFDMLNGEELERVVKKHRPDIIVPEIEAIRTERLYDFEKEGIQVVPSARAVNFTMNRKAIRDLAAQELGLKTAKYFYATTLEELKEYPCLSFEQGGNNSFYFAEEVLSTYEYKRLIKADDRATMLNLMVGLNGYTLCSGIICEELNGSDYLAIPFEGDEQNQNSDMEIGYITRKNSILSKVGNLYVSSLKKYLEQNTVSVE